MQGIGGGEGSDAHFDESCNRIDTDLMATEQVLIEHGMPHQPTTPLPRQGEVEGMCLWRRDSALLLGPRCVVVQRLYRLHLASLEVP